MAHDRVVVPQSLRAAIVRLRLHVRERARTLVHCLGAVLVLAALAAAQGLQLTAVAVPGRAEMRVDGAPTLAIVGVVIGTLPGSSPLAGGVVLDIATPQLFGLALPDARGTATLSAMFPVASLRGLDLLAQAWCWDLSVPLGTTGAISLSRVERATVPAVGAVADIVVLFGQSNAEGHADAATLPPSLRGPLPRCRMFRAATGAFEAMEHGVNTQMYGAATWCGPELTLAQRLTGVDRVVYLVKFATPGSTLGPTPGPWNEWSVRSGELYPLLMQRVRTAIGRVQADGLVPRVRGICMQQGESDAASTVLANGYESELRALIGTMRADFVRWGVAGPKPTPFVLGLISRRLLASHFVAIDTVRAAQRAGVQGARRAASVETTDLSLQSDQVHFDASAVLALGRRFADALLALP
jgi:hypothetical protein